MYTLPVESLIPDMILYEDIYTENNELLLLSNTVLTLEQINMLKTKGPATVGIADLTEAKQTRYHHLHNNTHFQHFDEVYQQSLVQFIRIIKTMDTGLKLNTEKLLQLRNTVVDAVRTGSEFMDYLYNLMPNENEITYNHCFNCGIMTYFFAKWCNYPPEELDIITLCGFLFDIGKTKIDDELLWKSQKLTPEEMVQMQHHIHLGYEMVRTKNLPPHVVSVMIMHHERCDGSGYPAGITDSKINPYALLAGLADTYEAMTHPRAHRTALTPFQAIGVLEKNGLNKYGSKNTRVILSVIAKSYLGRKVSLSDGTVGRIVEIHDDWLHKPTIFTDIQYIDLRFTPDVEINLML